MGISRAPQTAILAFLFANLAGPWPRIPTPAIGNRLPPLRPSVPPSLRPSVRPFPVPRIPVPVASSPGMPGVCFRFPVPVAPSPGMPGVCFRFPVPGSPNPESRLFSRSPFPFLVLFPIVSLALFGRCETFHARKCFCKNATYVNRHPRKTAPRGFKRYQVPVKQASKV